MSVSVGGREGGRSPRHDAADGGHGAAVWPADEGQQVLVGRRGQGLGDKAEKTGDRGAGQERLLRGGAGTMKRDDGYA